MIKSRPLIEEMTWTSLHEFFDALVDEEKLDYETSETIKLSEVKKSM